ncbi:hypothetical protein TDB9533_04545 [Thalassocella blandensis]|nr:hypothetical protein TDB9533_04545 [Thalassocella blandensis]
MNPHPSRCDISYSLETPEGVDLQVELAGPVVRVLAFTIDFAWRLLALVLCLIGLGIFGSKIGSGIWLLAFFLIEWFYPVLFEVKRHGQTPGKKAMGIMVVNDDLTPVNWGTSIIRNLLRAADFLPFAYLLGLFSMAAHPQFQRLGDIAAGTLVIHKTDNEQSHSIPKSTPVPPPFELNEREQTAIVEFTLRHQTLSDDRQQELASILEQTMDKKPQTILEHLRGIGAWLLGAR